MLRIIKAKKPAWVVGENVPGIINMALDDICADLESEGYEVWSVVFPSHTLGAWHKRDRLWIVASNTICNRRKVLSKEQVHRKQKLSSGKDGFIFQEMFKRSYTFKPKLLRTLNGTPNGVDRLKALGNGQTPCSTYVIGKWIMDVEGKECVG